MIDLGMEEDNLSHRETCASTFNFDNDNSIEMQNQELRPSPKILAGALIYQKIHQQDLKDYSYYEKCMSFHLSFSPSFISSVASHVHQETQKESKRSIQNIGHHLEDQLAHESPKKNPASSSRVSGQPSCQQLKSNQKEQYFIQNKSNTKYHSKQDHIKSNQQKIHDVEDKVEVPSNFAEEVGSVLDQSQSNDFDVFKQTQLIKDYTNSKISKGVYGKQRIACIIKRLKPSYVREHPIQVSRQLTIHRGLNHKNIIKCYDFVWDLKRVIVILILEPGKMNLMQYRKLFMRKGIEKKTLDPFDITFKKFSSLKARQILIQICKGLVYLHSKLVIHRDIKLENIIVTQQQDQQTFKISDFGVSVKLDSKEEQRQSQNGTFEYAAPEILKKQTYDCKVDIWSFGILAYELLVGKVPFAFETWTEEGRKNIELQILSFKPPDYLQNSEKEIISRCLKRSSEMRPSAQQLLKLLQMTQDQPKFGHRRHQSQ